MTNASYALQVALRARLIADPGVSALVPAANIRDAAGVPEVFPCIVIGQDQEIYTRKTLQRRHVTVHATLHLWDRSPGLASVKALAGAIQAAIRGDKPVLTDCRLVDWKFAAAGFMRDPDGVMAHGIIHLDALVELPS